MLASYIVMLGGEQALLALGLVLSFYMAYSLGANDAATPTDCAVGAGVLSIKRAVALFAVFSTLGALTHGYMVIKTIGKGIVPEVDVIGCLTTTLAACLWVTFCSRRGLDISITYSVVGSVLGYGLLKYGAKGTNLGVLTKIFLSWAASPLCSLLVAYFIYRVTAKVLRPYAYDKRVKRLVALLLVGSLCFSAYSFGANDVANATGVYLSVAEKLGRVPSSSAMFMLALLGSLGIALGGLTLGPKVIDTVAYRITRLDIVMGFAAELSNALVVFLFTVLPYSLFGYGLPISTSVASNGSIIGVGIAAHGLRSINKRTVSKLVSAWILTIPCTMALSGALYLAVQVLLSTICV